MKIFFLALAAFLLSVFQLALAPRLSFFGVAPDLILAGTVALAITVKDPSAKWLVFVWILLFDLVAGRPFGVLSLSLILVFFLINWLANSLLGQSGFWAVLFLGFLGIVFSDIFLYLFQKLFAFFPVLFVGESGKFGPFFSSSLSVLYDLAVFLAVFFLLGKFKSFFTRFLK